MQLRAYRGRRRKIVEITERKIMRTCLCYKQNYEYIQILVNGVPSFHFNICPDCFENGTSIRTLKKNKRK